MDFEKMMQPGPSHVASAADCRAGHERWCELMEESGGDDQDQRTPSAEPSLSRRGGE
jgi:hypothetical protein